MLQMIITGDESSVPLYDPETKQSSQQWKTRGEPCPIKALHARAKKSTMLVAFFNLSGIIHQEFVPAGVRIRQEEYCEILDRLLMKIRKKHPGMWRGGCDGDTDRDFLLLHDNAPCHTGVLTLAKVGESDIDMVCHLPYSLDLAPSDYFLFPHLKEKLRGWVFRNIPELQKEVRKIFRKIPPEKFEEAILDLPRHWLKCIKNGGAYFEGQGVDVEEDYNQLDIASETELESESDSD